jgi:hypothetical protein
MDMIDTTKNMGKDMLGVYNKFNHIRISGYIQPQFQVAGTKGAKSYEGGDFSTNVNNRFMLRRGRIRFDYATFNEKKLPKVQFAFQFDGTERGVFIRDFWGRLFENKYNCFNLTMGMFARPFGYEVNLSSSDRESPERGRMSQILMRTERDMGAMIAFAPQDKSHPLRRLEIDLGIFNGQGLTAPSEFDSYKDIISHIGVKNLPLSKKVSLSIGASYLNGGLRQNDKSRFNFDKTKNDYVETQDSLNIGNRSPRIYYGADLQIKYKNKIGLTEFRSEYIAGTQTGTSTSSETPGIVTYAPYIRPFGGAYLYLLQGIGEQHQIILKYDFYDPNSKIGGKNIRDNTQLSATDIKYSSFGFGYIWYINNNLKWVLWYQIVKNESTALNGYTSDLKDNIFTFRMQYRF